MPAHTLVMPKLGLTMQEGLLAEWKVAPGDRFRAGDILYLVETDKIANEIEADQDGELSEILVPAGETVPVGTPVARLAGASAATAAAVPSIPAAAEDRKAASPQQPPAAPEAEAGVARIVATPWARRLAIQHGVDLRRLRGTGPRGRIKSGDVLAAVATEARTPGETRREPAETGAAAGRRIAVSATQVTIARRLSASKREIPHFYVAMDADVGRLTELRRESEAARLWGKTTLTAWLVAAVGRALADMPEVDRVWDGNALIALETSDVGVAVDSDRGLSAPVIRGAGGLGLGEIAERLTMFADKARQGRLTSADTGGGAITLSNLGMHGVSALTPIINPGQAMILGVGAARPVFRPDESGQPALRHELNLVLAADHRVLNGVTAARFLKRIVTLLEKPLPLVLPPSIRATESQV